MVSRPHLFGKPISSFSKGDGLVKRDRQAANKVDSEANETENEDSYSDDDDFEEEEEEEEEEDEETIRARKEIEEKAKAKLLEEAFAYVANIKGGKRQGSGLSSANGNSKRKNKKKRNNSNNLDGITKAKLLFASNKGVISRVCTAPTIRMGAREEVKDGEENKKKLRIGRFWSKSKTVMNIETKQRIYTKT